MVVATAYVQEDEGRVRCIVEEEASKVLSRNALKVLGDGDGLQFRLRCVVVDLHLLLFFFSEGASLSFLLSASLPRGTQPSLSPISSSNKMANRRVRRIGKGKEGNREGNTALRSAHTCDLIFAPCGHKAVMRVITTGPPSPFPPRYW